LIIFYLDYL